MQPYGGVRIYGVRIKNATVVCVNYFTIVATDLLEVALDADMSFLMHLWSLISYLTVICEDHITILQLVPRLIVTLRTVRVLVGKTLPIQSE